MSRLLYRLLVAALALLALTDMQVQGSSDLFDLESELVLLEKAADTPIAAPTSPSQVLGAAKEYATNAVSAAVMQSNDMMAKAQAEGEKEAQKKIAEIKAQKEKEKQEQLAKDKAKREAEERAALLAQKQVELELVRAAARLKEKEAELAQQKQATESKEAHKASFRSHRMKPDRRGVIGGVGLGLPKALATPVAMVQQGDQAGAAPGTHLNKLDPLGKSKDMYGRKKACLKDIAAHFDEKAVYEQKKQALQQKLEGAQSRAMVDKLRKKLANLETWHQMMQKKFMMSAEQEAAHEKRMAKLFDAHLPEELKKQLDANKVAKRAAKPEPFPTAMKQAKKILRMKRTEIQKDGRLAALGHKKMLRPVINDPDFPSMDPISTNIRQRLYRRVHTDDRWSVDGGDAELGSNLVRDAAKLHGDFNDGPIAEPILRNKLWNPDTERLGVPNFLTNFPWPKVEEKITPDDKVKVEQSYHQTW